MKCIAFIKGKSNFYYWCETQEQKLKVLPCPTGFCCIGSMYKKPSRVETKTELPLCVEDVLRTMLKVSHQCTVFWYIAANILRLLAVILRLCFEPSNFLYYIKDLMNFTGAQREIFQGRGSFVKLGHFHKHFIKKSRKKTLPGKILKSFLLDTLKTTFWMANLT